MIMIIIWMRHAARLPPPPVFNDRRLLQLIAFSKLQIIDRSFGVCVFFICGWHLHISADICMFLMFAVNSLRVRRCWQSASLIAKYLRNALKIMPKSIQIHPKSVPNQPKWCQGAFRKRSREQVGSTCFPPRSFWCLFGATWAMWLGILCPAGRQGALKIKLFGIKSH